MVVFCFSICISQNTASKDKTLPMVGYWHKALQRNVNVAETQTFKFPGAKQAKQDVVKQNYNANWEIIDSTNSNYFIQYKVTSFYFDILNDSLNKYLNKMMPDFIFKYKTNEVGNFESVTNKEEIKETLNKAINSLDSKENWILLIQAFIELTIEKDLKKIHHFYGLQYKKNTNYTYDTIIESIKTLNRYKAKNVYKLVNLYPNENKAKFNGVIQSYQLNHKIKDKIRKEDLTINIEAEISLTEGYPIKTIFSYQSTSKTIIENITTTIIFTP